MAVGVAMAVCVAVGGCGRVAWLVGSRVGLERGGVKVVCSFRRWHKVLYACGVALTATATVVPGEPQEKLAVTRCAT